MSIQVVYIPSQYTFDGDWFCDHIGEPVTKYITIDSINMAGEHTTYQQEYQACADCGEEL